MTIIIKNLRKGNPFPPGMLVAIGRGTVDFRVDRESPVGNPFPMRLETERNAVCEKYEQFFYKQMLDETSELYKYVTLIEIAHKEGDNINLWCWCAPLRCHAETIKKYIERKETIMNVVHKDLLDVIAELLSTGEPNNFVLWTSNATLTSNGNAIMGRGIAKKLADLYPILKTKEGDALKKQDFIKFSVDKFGNRVEIRNPKLHIVHRLESSLGSIRLGAFPVKYGYWEDADLSIIRDNAEALRDLALNHPYMKFHMNFPGIGAGHLKRSDVLPILEEQFNDIENVYIYEYNGKLDNQERKECVTKRKVTLSFTGHRPEKLKNIPAITGMYERLLTKWSEKYELTIVVGGARGIDTIVGLVAAKMGLPVTLALPFIGCNPTDNNELMKYSNVTVVHVSEKPYTDNSQYQKRNTWMVDHSDMLIAYWNGTPGGTANCVRYAQRVGKKIKNLHGKE